MRYVLCVLASALVLIGCGGGSNAATKSTPATKTGATGAATTSSGGTALTIGQPMWAGTTGPGGSYSTVAVQVTNPNQDKWVAISPYTMTIFGDGDTILQVRENVRSIPVGATVWIIEVAIQADPAAIKRVDVQMTPRFQNGDYPAPPITVTQSNFREDKAQLLGIVKNDGTVDSDQIRVDGIIHDSAGGFVGTFQGFVDELAVGTTAPFQATVSGNTQKIKSSEVTYDVFATSSVDALFVR